VASGALAKSPSRPGSSVRWWGGRRRQVEPASSPQLVSHALGQPSFSERLYYGFFPPRALLWGFTYRSAPLRSRGGVARGHGIGSGAGEAGGRLAPAPARRPSKTALVSLGFSLGGMGQRTGNIEPVDELPDRSDALLEARADLSVARPITYRSAPRKSGVGGARPMASARRWSAPSPSSQPRSELAGERSDASPGRLRVETHGRRLRLSLHLTRAFPVPETGGVQRKQAAPRRLSPQGLPV
jgi:hypothetical protein